MGEGRLVTERMLDSDYEIVSVVIGDHVDDSFRARIPETAAMLLLERRLVSELVGFEFHAGIAACARRRRLNNLSDIEERLRRPQVTVVVCPFTVLPDNMGSIIRICAGFGVDALLVGEQSADPFSRRAIRVSMGNALQLTIVEPESTLVALAELKSDYGFSLIACTGGDTARSLPLPRPASRIALVLGNEAAGIDDPMLGGCDMQISIPMAGTTDSLNVANAAAVVLYQFQTVHAATCQ